MKVCDLIDTLKQMPEEMEVHAVCDYGDHYHTQQLIKLGEARIIIPYESAYSDTGLAIRDEKDEENKANEEEKMEKVVVLDN